MSEHITYQPVKRLERSSDGRIVAGVCAGLGRYFDLSPAVFRLGMIVLTVLGGAGILVYLAAVLVLPAEGKDESIAAEVLANRRDHPGRLIGLALVAVALFVLLSRAAYRPAAGAGWALVLVAGLLILWGGRRGRGILIAVAVLLSALCVAAVVAVVSAFAWFNVSLDAGVGKRLYVPASAADVRPSYDLGVGRLTLDLRNVAPTSPQHVRVKLGIGKARIIVPRGEQVRVDANVKAGEVNVFAQHESGRHASIQTGSGNLSIDADVGAGRLDVVRAG
jgi:phage shock protein PspC (stress-responsive transcriptional regulator)